MIGDRFMGRKSPHATGFSTVVPFSFELGFLNDTTEEYAMRFACVEGRNLSPMGGHRPNEL
jgi:hypothetical protein